MDLQFWVFISTICNNIKLPAINELRKHVYAL
jgi:hypothetical protein